jgi:hypothetical protein
MSTRLAQLAARLDALSRTRLPESDLQRITRWGNDLAIPLPKAVVAALGLREGDAIRVQASPPDMLTVAREVPGTAP